MQDDSPGVCKVHSKMQNMSILGVLPTENVYKIDALRLNVMWYKLLYMVRTSSGKYYDIRKILLTVHILGLLTVRGSGGSSTTPLTPTNS